MIELAAISSLGGGGITTRQTAEATPQAVPAVESGLAGQGLSGQMSSGHSQGDPGSGQSSGQHNGQPKVVDPDPLTGPPPTFLMNVLELDRDLAKSLARMNAEHTFPKEPASAPTDASTDPDAIEAQQPEVRASEPPVKAEPPVEAEQVAEPVVEPTDPAAVQSADYSAA